jgi:predicted O-linked N-acetylglucosamine transferase (SPINDLY family)
MRSEVTAEVFSTAIKEVHERSLTIGGLFGHAEKLKELGQPQLAAEIYKTWIAYNADHELLYAAYFNYGVALGEASDRMASINALRECIRLKPDFHPAYVNLGRALEDGGDVGLAVAQWMGIVEGLSAVTGESVKHKVMALQQIGRVLESVERDEAAEDALKQSIELCPGQTEAIQHWVSLRQRQCKWPVVADWEFAAKKNLIAGMSPLSLANFVDDPIFQLAAAHRYNQHFIGRPRGGSLDLGGDPNADPGRKLRVGYVSSDLREHAVGFALTDVFELHDRAKFEIFAYYCGIARTDSTQARIMAAADHWLDINGLDDDQAAMRIADDEIDILVDLNGYTKDARTKVFARRPAPIIVNWFGFPGTMGSPYHHYLIADPTIVPPEDEIYYTEKVLRLPCYQPNDRKRTVASNRPTRADAGLPEDAFVYCCLNGMQKLNAKTFDRWMTILEQVPDSVLWLLTGTTETNDRLRSRAKESGVAAQRIIFAGKAPNPQHLARYPLADLFLDNSPYGAHTTAADALWMGVPILTLPGRSFASRVCASVVAAAGLGELVCATPADYVARAIGFGRNPDRLAPYKAKLAENRDSCLLFDTPLLVANLEDLYRRMWDDFQRDALPVPDSSNLDIYHEIGLDLEDVELLDRADYFALYERALRRWNDFSPIQRDRRLWRNG